MKGNLHIHNHHLFLPPCDKIFSPKRYLFLLVEFSFVIIFSIWQTDGILYCLQGVFWILPHAMFFCLYYNNRFCKLLGKNCVLINNLCSYNSTNFVAANLDSLTIFSVSRTFSRVRLSYFIMESQLEGLLRYPNAYQNCLQNKT